MLQENLWYNNHKTRRLENTAKIMFHNFEANIGDLFIIFIPK